MILSSATAQKTRNHPNSKTCKPLLGKKKLYDTSLELGCFLADKHTHRGGDTHTHTHTQKVGGEERERDGSIFLLGLFTFDLIFKKKATRKRHTHTLKKKKRAQL